MRSASFIPETLKLELYAGDGASLELTVSDSAGAPIPLDGEVTAQIRKYRTDTSPLESFSVALDGHQATLKLTGAQTRDLGNFAGVWDCEWARAGAEPVTLVQGPATCALDVTRADD